MRAWVTRGGKLQLEEVPDPSPSAHELVMRVESISLNRGELRTVARAADGFVPGWDVAGVVVSPAADGSGPRVGQRVAALLPRGGWAELARVPSRQAAVVPDSVGLDVASTLPIAALTVLRALAVAGNLLTRRVLVTAAAGGVGQFAVQLAALAGARVVAISSRSALHARLRELGAAEVVPTIEEASGTYDLVLESVGGASFSRAIELVARGGTVVTIGNSSEQEATINPRALYSKGAASIYGLLIFEEVESGRIGARELEGLLALVAEGKLTSSISVRGPWTDLIATLEALDQRAYAGKAVLTVG
jgi:NADPH:quinone reductase-like Zn-dependent oxidoreductase